MDQDGESVFNFVFGEKNRQGNLPAFALVAMGDDETPVKYM